MALICIMVFKADTQIMHIGLLITILAYSTRLNQLLDGQVMTGGVILKTTLEKFLLRIISDTINFN